MEIMWSGNINYINLWVLHQFLIAVMGIFYGEFPIKLLSRLLAARADGY